MGDSSTSSSLTASLTGIGLFLVTTALSQWIQRISSPLDEKKRLLLRDNKACNHDCLDCDNDKRQLYQSRRLADRLSYENLNDLLSQEESISKTNSRDLHKSSEVPESTWSKQLNLKNVGQHQQGASISIHAHSEQSEQTLTWHQKEATSQGMVPLTRRFSEREVHPNAHYDFHPKNRNWRHFEHYNEHDRRQRQEKLRLEQQQQEQHSSGIQSALSSTSLENCNPPHSKSLDTRAANHATVKEAQSQSQCSASFDVTGTNTLSDETDDDDDDVNDAQSISSSSDSEEEEQFVWTKHRHFSSSALRSFSQCPRHSSLRNTPTSSDNEPTTKPVVHSRHSNYPPPSASSSIPPRTTTNVVSFPPRPVQMIRRFLSLDAIQDQGSVTEVKVSPSSSSPPPPAVMSAHYPKLRNTSLEVYNRQLRVEWNASIMPQKLVLIRHGQSLGNINEGLYSTTPDNAMPLTKLGWEQARETGAILKNKILTPGESVHFIVSPYVRTVETFHGIVSAWCDPMSPDFASIANHDEKVKAWYGRLMEIGLTWNEDSRLREQDFGNYQNPEVIKRAKEERHRFGAFYYRFPHGESASDVFDRVSTFLDSLWRSFEMNKSRNYVLVTHGIVLRVLLARYFRYTIDQFNMLANPKNCEMVVLGHSGDGKLDLEGRCALDVEENSETKQSCVTGYKFHKRLRILPRSAIRKVKIRISPDD